MKHVYHLLPAYVHRQLPAAQRDVVARHLRVCPDCRAAFMRDETVAQDLRRTMPTFGQPAPGRLARLWPSIWAQVLRGNSDSITNGMTWPRLPSFGMLLALVLVCAIFSSALLNGQEHAIAAPLPAVPADVQATATPLFTEEPGGAQRGESETPKASQTARVVFIVAPPMASPVPVAGYIGLSNHFR